MKSRRRRNRKNKGLLMLLGVIVAVFVILAVAVGIKFALGGNSSEKEKEEEVKKEVLVTAVEVECDNPVVRAGEPITLELLVAPNNATDKTVTWSVPEGMGTVDENGVYTPSVEAGKSNVEITATANDESKASATISVRVLEAIDPSKPMVAITYDDGPSDENTPIVLDALEKNFGVATFFMLGNRISGNEAILQRSYALGNELANHSYDHPQLTSLGSEGVTKQLSDTDDLIKAACPVDSIIMRPPYGAFNDTVKTAAARPIIMWSVDTLDWETRSASATYESCMTAKDGDIILMHDIHASTVAAAEDIIVGLQEKGFQLVTVSELYQYRKGVYGSGTVHYSMSVEEYNDILAAEAATATEEGEETSEAEEGATGTAEETSTESSEEGQTAAEE